MNLRAFFFEEGDSNLGLTRQNKTRQDKTNEDKDHQTRPMDNDKRQLQRQGQDGTTTQA
jgi:hypothetical protein